MGHMYTYNIEPDLAPPGHRPKINECHYASRRDRSSDSGEWPKIWSETTGFWCHRKIVGDDSWNQWLKITFQRCPAFAAAEPPLGSKKYHERSFLDISGTSHCQVEEGFPSCFFSPSFVVKMTVGWAFSCFSFPLWPNPRFWRNLRWWDPSARLTTR